MGNRESVGILTILAGVLIIIASVRGTLGALWSDVVQGNTKKTTTTTNVTTPGGSLPTLFSGAGSTSVQVQ